MIVLGTGSAVQNRLRLYYPYGELQANTDESGLGVTANNGNVISQTITVPTVGANTGFVAVQTYNYDSLNRLKDATENVTPHGGSQSQSWRRLTRMIGVQILLFWP